jgi:EmrB/QacA subfamily drug resistance transporter
VNPRWSLVVAILGSTMAFVDGTVVNVALPVMQHALGGTAAQVQWIVEAYALLLASLVLVGGALGDRLGRRKVFVAGVVLFTLASIACGAAPGPTALVIARGVQGAGAAMLVPGSLALISAAYPENVRGGAIGTWSAASSITTAIGPVLGGWVVAHASWRWIFFFNVPLGAAVVVIALLRVPESRDDDAQKRIDLVGAALAIVSLGAIVYGLLASRGIAVAGGVVLFVVFLVVEARSEHPMVPLSLFRSRTFSATNALTLLLYGALGGGMFFVPFELIQIRGYSPTEAGATFLPLVVTISAMSPWMGKIAGKHGARWLLCIGPIVAGAGFALLSFTIFPGIIVLGVGMGITVAPLTTAVMASVDAHHAGLASGVNNAVTRAAGLVAIAAMGVVLASKFDAALPESVRDALGADRTKLAGAIDPSMSEATKSSIRDAFMAGFRTVMFVCAALAAAGGVVAGIFVDHQTTRSSR